MARILIIASLFLFVAWLNGCRQAPDNNKEIVVPENGNKKFYGTVGTDSVYAYTLKNNRGLKAVISNYGATLLELWTPDRSGKSGDVILGYDSLSGYLQKNNPYFGAISRTGMPTGSVMPDSAWTGKPIPSQPMIMAIRLHGGWKGFDKVIWTVNQVNDSSLSLIL